MKIWHLVGIQFGWRDIRGISKLAEGQHSTVYLVEHDGTRDVVKEIGARRQPPMTEEEAKLLASQLRTYQELLMQTGVLLPSPAETSRYQGIGGGWEILLVAPYAGNSVAPIIKQGSSSEIQLIVAQILSNCRKILDTAEGYDLRVGLDPKPANWVMNGQKLLYLTDVMPPRYREGSEVAVIDFPDPEPGSPYWEAVYYKVMTTQGVLQVLYDQLSRLRPDLRPLFRETIFETIRAYGLEQWFSESISERFRLASSEEQRVEIVRNLQPSDIDAVRTIACEIWHERQYPQSGLDALFSTTTADSYLGPDSMNTLKRYLLAMMG